MPGQELLLTKCIFRHECKTLIKGHKIELMCKDLYVKIPRTALLSSLFDFPYNLAKFDTKILPPSRSSLSVPSKFRFIMKSWGAFQDFVIAPSSLVEHLQKVSKDKGAIQNRPQNDNEGPLIPLRLLWSYI